MDAAHVLVGMLPPSGVECAAGPGAIAIIRMDADGVADLVEEEACDALGSAGDRILGAGIRSAGLGGFADSLSDAVERINAVGGAAGFGELPCGLDVC